MESQPTSFSAAHAFLQHQVDAQLLAGVSMVVLKDGVPVDRFCTGLANLQAGEALRPDHIHRAFSNTKLMTSVLVLMLVDQGRFALDDPIKTWIPAFGKLQVLKLGGYYVERHRSAANRHHSAPPAEPPGRPEPRRV